MSPANGGGRDRYQVDFGTALGWSFVMGGGQYAISTVVMFVMAGILGPSIFGLVAMAVVYLAFIQLVLRQGMVQALVQRPNLEAKHLDSAFWLTMAGGALLTIASLLLSRWWADLNRTPELEPVINVMTLLVPLQALVVVQESYLTRHMDFKGLAIRTNLAALIGGVVGVVLAIVGFGVWALVAQHILRALVDVAVLWTISEWRPKWHFSWDATREILSFSSLTALGGLGTFVNTRADALLIGLFFGPTAVGLYRLAARIVEIVSEVTVSAFHSVSLPELSRVEYDRERFTNRVRDITKLATMAAFPLLAIVAGSSPQLMALLGREWQAAAAPLSVLCIVGAAYALTIFIGPVMLAAGKPRVFAASTWVFAGFSAFSFLLAGFLLIDAPIGAQVVGVAWARVAIFATVLLAIAGWTVKRYTDATIASIMRAITPATLAAALGLVAARVLAVVSGVGSDFFDLLLVVIPSALIAAGTLWVTEPTVRQILDRIARAFRRPWRASEFDGNHR